MSIFIGTCAIFFSGYFIYKIIENNNDKVKFLAQNTTVDNAIKKLSKLQEIINNK